MLTDTGWEWRNGVISVADVTPSRGSGSSPLATIGLAALVFAIGALAGFIGRLLWPQSR